MNCSATATSTNKPCRAPAKLSDGTKLYCLRHGDKKSMKRIEREITEENVLDLVNDDMDPSIVCVKRFPYASIAYKSGYYPVYFSDTPEKDEFRKPGEYFSGLSMDAEPVIVEAKEYYSFSEFVNMHCFGEKIYKGAKLITPQQISKRKGRTELPKKSKYLFLDENKKQRKYDLKRTRDILCATYASLVAQHPDYSGLKSLYEVKGSIQIIGYGATGYGKDGYENFDTFFGAEAIVHAMLTDNILWDPKLALKCKYMDVETLDLTNHESRGVFQTGDLVLTDRKSSITNVTVKPFVMKVVNDLLLSQPNSPVESPELETIDSIVSSESNSPDTDVNLAVKLSPIQSIAGNDKCTIRTLEESKLYTSPKQQLYELSTHRCFFTYKSSPKSGDGVFQLTGNYYVPIGTFEEPNVILRSPMAELRIVKDSVDIINAEPNNKQGLIIDTSENIIEIYQPEDEAIMKPLENGAYESSGTVYTKVDDKFVAIGKQEDNAIVLLNKPTLKLTEDPFDSIRIPSSITEGKPRVVPLDNGSLGELKPVLVKPTVVPLDNGSLGEFKPVLVKPTVVPLDNGSLGEFKPVLAKPTVVPLDNGSLGEFKPLPVTRAKNNTPCPMVAKLPNVPITKVPEIPKKGKTSTTFFLRGTNPK